MVPENSLSEIAPWTADTTMGGVRVERSFLFMEDGPAGISFPEGSCRRIIMAANCSPGSCRRHPVYLHTPASRKYCRKLPMPGKILISMPSYQNILLKRLFPVSGVRESIWGAIVHCLKLPFQKMLSIAKIGGLGWVKMNPILYEFFIG